MQETQQQRFLKTMMGDDMDFYEQFLCELSEDEFQRFLDENPDFFNN